jgi:hypothetical protein
MTHSGAWYFHEPALPHSGPGTRESMEFAWNLVTRPYTEVHGRATAFSSYPTLRFAPRFDTVTATGVYEGVNRARKGGDILGPLRSA